MRSLLRVAAIAALTVIAPLAAVTATPGAAHAAAGAAADGVQLAIDSITPQVARPGSTVTVSGTISNGTSAPLAGLTVQLDSSPAWFSTRDDMDSYAGGTLSVPLYAEGNSDVLTVRPGGTVGWRAQFSVAAAGISSFGVYPLQAQLTGLAATPVPAERTLLPLWPDNTSGIAKLKIAWVWPLIDQPHRQACSALTSNGLAQSLSGGGRLGNLLTAAAANPQASLTWAIDPALLSDVSTMTQPYEVGGKPANCTGASPEPASTAASRWLAALKVATAGQPVVITPYGNTDVAALTHPGPGSNLNSSLSSNYRLGEAVTQRVLAQPFGTNLALPAGGLADQSVLTTLAATEHVTSVVLSSSEMPPVDSTVFSADDAVTSTRTVAGTKMNVLLADDTLTGLLKSASGTMGPGARFSLQQRFLAETAMIDREVPGSSRSVVVSPPETWDPSLALAQALLQETSAPWLQPVTLGSLAGSHDSESTLARKAPPDTKISSHELTRGYLAAVSALGSEYGIYKSMLYQAPAPYTTGLDEALAATESSAWRGPAPAAQGQALVTGFSAYLTHAVKKVKIITSPEITMAGAAGVLPIPIHNGLAQQNVQVKLSAIVAAVAGQTHPLTVARMDNMITINAGQTVVVKVHVSSAPIGSTRIQLQLVNRDGKQIPFVTASLTVHSTRYGQAILILIAGAIGLLVLASLFRAWRRWLGAPGNVMEGEHDLTEAPDDLADARRWADDT